MFVFRSLLFTTTLKIGYFLSWCKQSWQNNDLGYSAWGPGKLALNGLPWRCLWSEPWNICLAHQAWKLKCPWKQKVTRKGESKVINKNPIQYLQSSMNVVLNTSSNVTWNIMEPHSSVTKSQMLPQLTFTKQATKQRYKSPMRNKESSRATVKGRTWNIQRVCCNKQICPQRKLINQLIENGALDML